MDTFGYDFFITINKCFSCAWNNGRLCIHELPCSPETSTILILIAMSSPSGAWNDENIQHTITKATFVKTFSVSTNLSQHDDVIKWKHFPRYWQFVRGIHRSPVNSQHKGQWRVALMFSLICVWINGWVNNRDVGDLRRYRAHYDIIVMGTLQ